MVPILAGFALDTEGIVAGQALEECRERILLLSRACRRRISCMWTSLVAGVSTREEQLKEE